MVGRLGFNASQEPVKTGRTVTSSATPWDGWEAGYKAKVRFYFRPDGARTYRHVRTVTPTCSGGGALYHCTAKLRVKQRRTGTWKAVSVPTKWFTAPARTDRVKVT